MTTPSGVEKRSMIVLIDAPLPQEQAERIRRLSPGIELIGAVSAGALRRADVIYTKKAAFDPSEAPHLRWVQLNTVAVNHILDQPIASTDIPVANVRGAYSVAVAELTVGMVLALTRRLPLCHSLQSRRQWPDDFRMLRGENCYDKTLGILGYGSIGRHIARMARAMGMRVLAYKRHPEIHCDSAFRLPGSGDPDGSIPDGWFGPEGLMQMLSATDILVLTLPLTDATRNLIGGTELEVLPPGAYVVSVGRGDILDEGALVQSLRAGRLGGAALDVFSTEPLGGESPLWEIPNVLVVPHLGSYTREQPYLAAEVLIENLSRDLRQRPLINLVNLKQGY